MDRSSFRVTALPVPTLVAILFAILVVTLVSACGPEGGEAGGGPAAVRDSLPGGIPLLRYGSLAGVPVDTVAEELRIGVQEGDADLTFGAIKGVEATKDGTILVLDAQALTVRAFDAQGRYVRTVVHQGEGPGEIASANGILLVGDTALWIQDHARWGMLAVDLQGNELLRTPMPVRSYQYLWNGTVDEAGRIWKPSFEQPDNQPFPPPEGPTEYHLRSTLKSYDPATGQTDSLALGEMSGRSVVAHVGGGGFAFVAVPADPQTFTLVDRSGGFWQAFGGAYRVARLDAAGDTVRVVDVAVEPVAITDGDRRAFVDEQMARLPENRRRAVEEAAELMPGTRPAIESLMMDDRGLLWVERARPRGALPVYDRFDADGAYHGAVALGFAPAPNTPLRVRNGRVYGVVRDDLDVEYVVRSAPLPAG